MGLFGERFDRKLKHHQVIEHRTGDTGREIKDRVAGKIKGNILTRQKILQKNLYRKSRGKGNGIFKSRRFAKAKAAEIVLREMTGNRIRRPHKKHRR